MRYEEEGNLINNSRTDIYVSFDTEETAASLPMYRALLPKIAYHTIDFLRISLVTQTLMARWLYQLFLELNRYHASPSDETQKTWLGFPVMFLAAALTVFVKILNHRHLGEQYYAAQDYLFALFSSSLLYVGLDLIFGAQSITFPVFVISSLVFIPLAAAFFYKLVLPDSNNYFIYRPLHFQQLHFAKYPATKLNILTGVGYATMALPVPWAVIREVVGKTVSLPHEVTPVVAAYFAMGGLLGYRLTSDPYHFQFFVMLSKSLKDGALSYAGVSAIIYMCAVYSCKNKDFCLSDGARNFFTAFCFMMSLAIALYSATTTLFRFEKNHEVNLELQEKIEKMKQKISTGFRYAEEKISKCCAHSNVQNENSSLVRPV